MSEQAFNAKYNLQEVNKLNLLQSSQNDNIDKLKKKSKNFMIKAL